MAFFRLKNILLTYWIYVISFPFGYPVIAEETTDNFFNDSLLIQKYIEEICQLNDTTCSIIDQIPQSLQDLRTRNCMCDSDKCPFYKDCCRDVNQTEPDIGVEFICTKTRFDGGVYMIQSCPEEWNGKSIQEKCLAQNSTPLSQDILPKLPVTSTTNGITYSNVFCAICNEEKNYDFWNVGFTYEFIGSKNNHPKIGAEDILAKLSFNQTGQTVWSAYINESLYKCYLEPKVPSRITSLRYCVPDVIKSCKNGEICNGFTSYVYSGDKVYKNLGCARCNNRTEELKGCLEKPKYRNFDETVTEIFITDSLIPKVPLCEEFPKNTPAYELLCKNHYTSETHYQIKDCYRVQKSSKISCFISKYYYRSRNDYYYVNNETVFIYEYDMEFPENEWAALDDDKIFVCGRQIPRTKFQKIISSIDHLTSEILIKISIFCIVLHLLKFWLRSELRNLFRKNLASSCVALLIAFSSFEIGPWLSCCKVAAIVVHYGFLCCFTWILVISYDIWLNVYRGTVKLHLPTEEHHSKFLIYSIIAWISPFFAVGPAMVAEFTPSSVVSCGFKPGYGEFDQCFIARHKPFIYFFLCPTFVIFIANIYFFAHTAYLINLSRRTVNSAKHYDFKVYFKLGLSMGLTWTLGLLVALTNDPVIKLLFTVFNMSQGISIFFVFTLDRKVIDALLHFHKKPQVPESTQMVSL